MTLIIRTQRPFTDTTKRVARYDPILAPGSLLMIEPGKPGMSWNAGIPADGALVPNVALIEAKGLIAGATDADVSPTFYYPAGFTGSVGKIERTTKGGVHGIPSQANAVFETGPQILFPLKVIKYLLNNPRHSYYISSWSRFTRGLASAPPTNMPVAFNIAGQFGSDGDQITLASCGSAAGSTTAVLSRPSAGTPFVAGQSIASIQTATPNRFSVATADWYNPRGTYPSPMPGDGTNNALNGASAAGVIGWGEVEWKGSINPAGTTFSGQNTNAMGTGNAHHRMPSMILYRFVLEDLTVTGRSFATADAIDAAQFAAAFGTGGRYNGDTYTDPATIA